jgi:hypothetical protein
MVDDMDQIKAAARPLAAAVMVSVLLTACGGGGDDSTSDDVDVEVASLGTGPDAPSGSDVTDSSAPTDPEEAQLAFAECMREHGIDVPDPGAGGGIRVVGDAAEQEEMEAAMEACEPLLENAREAIARDPEQEAELREQMLEFTDCMREQGIDMPDPVFSDDGGFTVQAGAGEGSGSNGDPRADDDFLAAAEECGGGDGMMFSTDSVVEG